MKYLAHTFLGAAMLGTVLGFTMHGCPAPCHAQDSVIKVKDLPASVTLKIEKEPEAQVVGVKEEKKGDVVYKKPINRVTYSNGLVIGYKSEDSDVYVTVKSDGSFSRPYNVRTEVLTLSSTGLTLECIRSLGMFYSDGDERWREVYVVKDGKLTLEKILNPKVVPATTKRIDWDKGNEITFK